MKNVTNSLYAQILYMIGVGAGFLFIPNMVLPIFGLPPTEEVWIRILGALALVLSLYYYTCVQSQHVPFFKATVWGRYFFSTCLIALVLFKLAPPVICLFAATEGLLAVWTHLALKNG